MSGFVPAIHTFAAAAASHAVAQMRGGWVYIMTNRPNGTLYIGVTADIARRAYEHREGLRKGLIRRYALTRSFWFEFHEDITAAIQRESKHEAIGRALEFARSSP